MRTVLVVSPHFPPVNAPDLHRVRMSLPYYREFGWSPIVLTVRPEAQEEPRDEGLLATVPSDVPVVSTGALPLGWSRRVGIGNVGLRAIGHLALAGARVIRDERVDLVFFSTTMFSVMPLGRVWKRRFGVPYVIDLQDPWFSTYYDDKPKAERPPKYALARAMHRRLEAWTMRRTDGVVAVADAYLDTIRERYPWISADRCATIPFGASTRDFEVAETRAASSASLPGSNPRVRTPGSIPGSDPGYASGLYVGRGGPDMGTALRILFRAFAAARPRSAALSAATLEFIGTDYARADRARKSVEPVAAEAGVADAVRESTGRIPFLDALARLRGADFLLLVGSDDPQYSPSKIYPYLVAGRPLVAVVHERSPIVDLIRRSGAGVVVTFASRDEIDRPAARLAAEWPALLERTGARVDLSALSPIMAQALTARQCQLFDRVLQPATVTEAAACTE